MVNQQLRLERNHWPLEDFTLPYSIQLHSYTVTANESAKQNSQMNTLNVAENGPAIPKIIAFF